MATEKDVTGRLIAIAPAVATDMWTLRAQARSQDPIIHRLAAEEHLITDRLRGKQSLRYEIRQSTPNQAQIVVPALVRHGPVVAHGVPPILVR